MIKRMHVCSSMLINVITSDAFGVSHSLLIGRCAYVRDVQRTRGGGRGLVEYESK